jgi:hypothetical protein
MVAMTMIALAATQSLARDEAVYYGPKQGFMGVGYKHSVRKDGSWRIVTEYHSSDPDLALNIALYRAAELAREAGQPYVQILDGYGMARLGVASGFVFARPSESSAAPMDCKRKHCFTAEVAEFMVTLGNKIGR